MKNQLLKAIVEMPLSAACYMGKHNKYRKSLNNEMEKAKIEATPVQIGKIKAYYLLADDYGKKFAKEMGWV